MEAITRREFIEHCKQNEDAFNEVIPVLKKLEPLADPVLIKTLKDSAELTNATRRVSNRITKGAKSLAIYLGIISVILLIVKQTRDLIIGFIVTLK